VVPLISPLLLGHSRFPRSTLRGAEPAALMARYDRAMDLRDEVIVLRVLDETDVPMITLACQDPSTTRFTLTIPSPYTEAHAREYVAQCRDADPAESCPRAIADATTGALLGAIDVRLGEIGSVGYWVVPEARGRGVATRALVLTSRWALSQGGVERLELTTHPENVASQRVAEKAGFTREGVLRSRHRFREGRRDSVLFSLLPSDLSPRPPGASRATRDPSPAGGALVRRPVDV
jgi:RimJ/RimL family protein N-acetyltransferase